MRTIAVLMMVAMGVGAMHGMEPTPGQAGKQTREYVIHVDSKPAGALLWTIAVHKDGRLTATAQADVHVGHSLFAYAYSYRGAEEWTDDRLTRVEGRSNDNGKKTTLIARVGAQRVELEINGKSSKGSPVSWTSSYWRLPAAGVRGQDLAILDADTGEIFSGKLEPVRSETLKVDGRSMPCTCYRLTAKVSANLWFDDEDRLVRQTYVDDGHPTEIMLVRTRTE